MQQAGDRVARLQRNTPASDAAKHNYFLILLTWALASFDCFLF